MSTARYPTRVKGAGLLALATVLLTAGCAEDPAEPFVVEGEGAISGTLFYDADRDGDFDPFAGDTALAGASLVVRERGAQSVYATTQTDAEGGYSITGLPAGTHDLFIDTTSISSAGALVFCQNPVPVSVYINETTTKRVAGQQSCLVSITEAESMTLGEYVTVRGIVTSTTGQIDASYTYIEDETSGIRIFDGSIASQNLEIGDQVQLSGTLAAYGGDLQLTGVTVNGVTPDVISPVLPMATTTGEITAVGSAPADPLQGRLVKVENAEFVTAFGGSGLHEQNAYIDDGSGTTILRIEDGVMDRAELNNTFTVGKCYDITGVIGSFDGAGQIFPRSVDDWVEVACE